MSLFISNLINYKLFIWVGSSLDQIVSWVKIKSKRCLCGVLFFALFTVPFVLNNGSIVRLNAFIVFKFQFLLLTSSILSKVTSYIWLSSDKLDTCLGIFGWKRLFVALPVFFMSFRQSPLFYLQKNEIIRNTFC